MILKDNAIQGTQNQNLDRTRANACLSRALLNELLLKKNFPIMKESLQLDANMFSYVKINDFEGFDHSERQGCTRGTKLESRQYAGGPLSTSSSIKRCTFRKKLPYHLGVFTIGCKDVVLC